MSGVRRIVVVGASLAGLRAVESARAAGFDGELVLVGDEAHLPYDRPPLSKEVLLGAKAPDETPFRTLPQLEALQLELRLGVRATGLDVARSRVVFGDDELPFDGLVIATGTRARRMHPARDLSGVYVLRTRDDAAAVAKELQQGPRVVVIGAGFIGGEVASSARSLGLSVTMLEAAPHPLQVLGEGVAHRYVARHSDHGVDVRCAVRVLTLEGEQRVEGVRLSTGELIPADLVIIGVGAEPATQWLTGSGLDVTNGVLCDSRLCAGPAGVYAAGDVARWMNPRYRRQMRVEHWTNASEQGHVAARNLLGAAGNREYAGIPYFWSDQHGLKLQFSGDATAPEQVWHRDASGDGATHVTLYRKEDRVAAALAFGRTPLFARLRALLTTGARWSEAVDLVNGCDWS
jgi:NADPH-dependent 2,4-dienoyl-CoA reductase/sulfur reductase-like enzyme